MDRKQMCVANVQYKRPTADEAKRTRNLLGYLTYRDSRDQGVKMVAGIERWVDRGMGGSVAAIAQRCEDLRSDHVLMFSLVINPNPDLIALIPSHERERFVRELTEKTVDDFFDARGLDTGCEMSYVLHHRTTDDMQLHNPHTHVVLPGTVWSEESGGRIPLYFSQNKKVNHIEMLHEVTEHNMMSFMERYAGRDWEYRVDRLNAERAVQQEEMLEESPHTTLKEADVIWDVWYGVRQMDEEHVAVGIYLRHGDVVQFRTIHTDLSLEEAQVRAYEMAIDAKFDKPNNVMSLEL